MANITHPTDWNGHRKVRGTVIEFGEVELNPVSGYCERLVFKSCEYEDHGLLLENGFLSRPATAKDIRDLFGFDPDDVNKAIHNIMGWPQNTGWRLYEGV
jgi:hypothetical protein